MLEALNDSDLRELGVTLGQLRKLLDRIGARGRVAAESASSGPEPELRRISVLFSDLVGLTELLARIDREEMRGILQTYYDAAQGAARNYGGYVAALQGDGVIILFGFPVTRGVSADRAISAALELRSTLENMPRRMIGAVAADITARIGIATARQLSAIPTGI